jgi:hypothetical protein
VRRTLWPSLFWDTISYNFEGVDCLGASGFLLGMGDQEGVLGGPNDVE